MSCNCSIFSGHFTQIVWKGSKEVGIGRSQMKNGTWIVIANYFPAGNYEGENAANVMPPKDGKFGHSNRKGRPGRHICRLTANNSVLTAVHDAPKIN